MTAQYNYTAIQERIFNYLILHLQGHIKQVRHGLPITQLDLFGTPGADLVRISIPMHRITAPNNYARVHEAVKDMISKPIAFRSYRQGKEYSVFAGLFASCERPLVTTRGNKITVTMLPEVAKWLVYTPITWVKDKLGNEVPMPINYTSFRYDICEGASSKYTSRIYKMLRQFKDQGAFNIDVEELRTRMGLDESYRETANMKLRILKPVAAELARFGDIWYDVNDPGFEIKNGKQVIQYRFKIITAAKAADDKISMANLEHMLRNRFGCRDYPHIHKLGPILAQTAYYKTILWKMEECTKEIKKSAGEIRYPAAYVTTALINYFNNLKK